MNQKRKAAEFKRKYSLKTINSADLWEALAAQGYTLVEFNSIENKEDEASLIEALQLEDQIARSKCFTYKNDKYRIVFIHEDLNDEERTIVLAHEEGHIWNGHLSVNNVLGTDVIQEYEANEFAHHLLKDKTGKKKRTKVTAVILSLVLLLTVGTGIFLKQNHDKAVYTDDLYRTETGGKYHVRDCMYIKDKNNVYRLTQEEFDSGEYEPCGACKPNER